MTPKPVARRATAGPHESTEASVRERLELIGHQRRILRRDLSPHVWHHQRGVTGRTNLEVNELGWSMAGGGTADRIGARGRPSDRGPCIAEHADDAQDDAVVLEIVLPIAFSFGSRSAPWSRSP